MQRLAVKRLITVAGSTPANGKCWFDSNLCTNLPAVLVGIQYPCLQGLPAKLTSIGGLLAVTAIY
jgi:hypothetical protein